MIDDAAGAVPGRRRVTGHIVGIEQVRLAAASARHPLPAQMVAGEIAIEQMPVEPVSPNAPVHFPDVHHITGQPHAGMVVQITRVVERAHRHVDHRYAGGCLTNISGQKPVIAGIGQRTLTQGSQDLPSPKMPDMAKVFPPAEFENEFVLHIQRVPGIHRSQHLGQAHHAVGDIGRKTRNGTLQRVAAARVIARSHRADARKGGLACGFEGTDQRHAKQAVSVI